MAAGAGGGGGSGGGEGGHDIVKSSSDYSCHSYESFVVQASGQDDNNKEKISIRSEGLDSVSEHRRVPNLSKIRKVSAVSVLIFEGDSIYISDIAFKKTPVDVKVKIMTIIVFRLSSNYFHI